MIWLRGDTKKSLGATLGLAEVAFPASLLPALAAQLHKVLTLNLVFAPTLVMVLFLGVLSPQLSQLFAEPKSAQLVLGSCVILLVVAVLSGSFQADQPRANSLSYAVQQGFDQAIWLSLDEEVDTWTKLFLEEPQLREVKWLFPLTKRPMTISPAPLIPLAELGLTYELARAPGVSSSNHRQSIELKIRIKPGTAGSFLTLQLAGVTAVLAARVQGQELESTSKIEGVWSFRYLAPPLDGFEMELQIQTRGEPVVRVVESRRGLPESVRRTRHRPAHMMSRPYPY